MENDKPRYNGWVIFLLVIGNICTKSWVWVGVLSLSILYVGWIEYLRMKYNLAKKDKR